MTDPLQSLLDKFEAWSRAGLPDDARRLEQELARRAGHEVRFWTGLAERLMRLGLPGRALAAARQAAALAPGDVDARLCLARMLAGDGRWAAARALADELESEDAAFGSDRHAALAGVHEAVLQPWRALPHAERAVAGAPADADRRHRLAVLHRQLGRLAEAREGAASTLRLAPDHAGALWLRTDLGDGDHVDDLRRRIGAGLPRGSETAAWFALGRELERRERWEEAFAAVAAGAERIRAARSPSAVAGAAESDAFLAAAEAERPRAPGLEGPAPIFVVGLPRSGTSLVERIIAAHPAVRSLGETPAFDRALFDLAAEAGADGEAGARRALACVPAAELGRRYLAEAGVAAGERTVDKRPLNILNVEAILASLPGARVVLVERDPLDAGWALFKTLFAPGAYDFSYDQAATGAFVAGYMRLAGHWKVRHPRRVLSVAYEDVVSDVEAAARSLLSHCGLGWDDRCARPHEASDAATTASAVQVRSPVYRTSVGLSRRYGAHLEPLRQALERCGVSLASAGGGS